MNMKVQKRSCTITFELQGICLQQYIDLRSRFSNALLDKYQDMLKQLLKLQLLFLEYLWKKTMSTTAKKFE